MGDETGNCPELACGRETDEISQRRAKLRVGRIKLARNHRFAHHDFSSTGLGNGGLRKRSE